MIINSMLKLFFKILFVLLTGAFGGILGYAFVLPYLAGKPYFQDFQFVKSYKERQVIINPKEEVVIQENTALKNAVEKVKRVVVGIKSKTKTGKILSGSGLIVTSDGLVLTLFDIAARDAEVILFLNGKELPAQVLQRKSPFALLKIEETGLPTISFADFGKMKLGERVFLLGAIFRAGENNKEAVEKIVNEGIVKYYDQDFIQTNIFEKYFLWGSSLFNIEGELLGINTIDQEGKVAAIPVNKVREFLGF